MSMFLLCKVTINPFATSECTVQLCMVPMVYMMSGACQHELKGLMSLEGGLKCLHSADDTSTAWLTTHGIMASDVHKLQ